MRYGYARSGVHQNLTFQMYALEEHGCEKIYSDNTLGPKEDKPRFKELLSILKEEDTLIVTKLDRFAKSADDAIQIIKSLFDKNITVHILNIGIVENTPKGRLIFNIMSAFAEFEKDIIIEHNQESKEFAEQHEVFRESSSNNSLNKQIEYALKLLETYSYKEVEGMTGISRSTLIRAKQKSDYSRKH
ncbi:recombinase family protein [Scopulibacillus cellulosilyticus]|uniref:Recombinase family protein n=1 Tax=Scopulibacillus cellulosilyticus TaxID=2665665 RepID=A0ABW2PVX1_9BACL